ncbi:PucR family transcriptional regulator [Mycolicibacillus koreensis]|nr:PucR family transcriptional regulator [Mycolicibacillus koreensis]
MAGEAAIPQEVLDRVGDVAELVLAELDDVVEEMNAAELGQAPELAADAAMLADVSASNRANAARLLAMLIRREAEPATIDIPPEALDLARTVARRGIDFDVIFHAYRHGQNVAWQRYMSCAGRSVSSGPLLSLVLETASRRISSYVDHVIGRVIAAAQHEREEVLGGALARRAETVRLILDDAPIDAGRAGQRLGYDLNRWHTALVLWTQDSADVQGALESAATVLARTLTAHRPLTLSVGSGTLWAWLGTATAPVLEALRAAIDTVPPEVRVAVGPPREGISGFRRSHEAAVVIHNLLAGYPGGTRIALYQDLEITVLAAHDLDRAAEFVAATLGPLAMDTPTAARLRETVRVFLDEAENGPAAAARLHTHRNTVLQRVARATELLGRAPGQSRLATELALELAHQIGPRVLSRP